MGSRLYSNTTNLLGGRDFADATHRQHVADVLGTDAARIPTQSGWAYDQIVEGVASGAIRGLWVIATNAAHSWIGSGVLDELLDRLEFLVVQDMYAGTETASVPISSYRPPAGVRRRERSSARSGASAC
jgi:predicted molibdopterin-dependent oxidoreductase YjgC